MTLFNYLSNALIALWVLALSLNAAAQTGEGLEKGLRFFAEGKWTEAQQFFEAVVKRSPVHSLATFYLGRIFFDQENYNKALDWFKKAVELEDGQSDYHLWLGRAYGQKAKRASIFKQPFLAWEVKKHLEKAVELNPDNRAARFDLARYYLMAPGILGGSKEKAREQANEIKKRDSPQGHEIWGMIYEAEANYEQAEKEYLASIDLAPNNQDVYYALASLYEKTGQDEKASETLVKIGELEAGKPECKACETGTVAIRP